MERDRLAHLLAARENGIEARERLLENDRYLVPPHPPHLLLGKREEIAPLEEDRAPVDPAGRGRDEAHDRKRRHALPAARFADEPHRLRGRDLEAHAVDDARGALRGLEDRPEILHVEQRFHTSLERAAPLPAHRHAICLGSNASFRASPRRLNPITVTAIAIPGKVESHQALRSASRPSKTIWPQLGVGGGTPSPRKLREASARMIPPIRSVAATMMTVSVFGMRCLQMTPLPPRAERLGGLHVIEVPEREHLRAHEARGRHPAGRPEENDDEPDRSREERDAGEEQKEPRYREQRVDDPHENRVDGAAEIARRRADERAEDDRDRDREEPDRERDARAVDDPGENVPARICPSRADAPGTARRSASSARPPARSDRTA